MPPRRAVQHAATQNGPPQDSGRAGGRLNAAKAPSTCAGEVPSPPASTLAERAARRAPHREARPRASTGGERRGRGRARARAARGQRAGWGCAVPAEATAKACSMPRPERSAPPIAPRSSDSIICGGRARAGLRRLRLPARRDRAGAPRWLTRAPAPGKPCRPRGRELGCGAASLDDGEGNEVGPDEAVNGVSCVGRQHPCAARAGAVTSDPRRRAGAARRGAAWRGLGNMPAAARAMARRNVTIAPDIVAPTAVRRSALHARSGRVRAWRTVGLERPRREKKRAASAR
jgi:hypothetical protein